MNYVGGTVDSCGEANQNLIIHGKCPKCAFRVISEFSYDEHSSNRLMLDENEDSHRQSPVIEERWISKWMTIKNADINERGLQ